MDRFQPPTARDDLRICGDCGEAIQGNIVWIADVPYCWECVQENQDEDDE